MPLHQTLFQKSPPIDSNLKKIVGSVFFCNLAPVSLGQGTPAWHKKSEEERNANVSTCLHASFSRKKKETVNSVGNVRVLKDLPHETQVFVRLLYIEGYFRDASFLRNGKLELASLDCAYARGFILRASEKFGRDYQEIAKWLSGKELKKVASFGCPSTTRRNVFSAKRLRNYFNIPEHIVCKKCAIKESCKFVNRSVCNGKQALDLAAVMRILMVYSFNRVPPQLLVPHEIKYAVMRLLTLVSKMKESASLFANGCGLV